MHHSSKALKGTKEPSAGALIMGLEYENRQVLETCSARLPVDGAVVGVLEM